MKKCDFDTFELQEQSLSLVVWILIIHHKVSQSHLLVIGRLVGLLVASKQDLECFLPLIVILPHHYRKTLTSFMPH